MGEFYRPKAFIYDAIVLDSFQTREGNWFFANERVFAKKVGSSYEIRKRRNDAQAIGMIHGRHIIVRPN